MPSRCSIHENHTHVHGEGCGHTAIHHSDHTDYLHEGHLHRSHGDHVDEHVLEVSDHNPSACTPAHSCDSHDAAHRHGPGCGHEPVPHGDHVDYLADGHLHHAHDGHCDDHGKIAVTDR